MSKNLNKKKQRIIHKSAATAEHDVDNLIKSGWTITHMSSAATSSNVYLTFVLEK